MKNGWMHTRDENGLDVKFAPRTDISAVEGLRSELDALRARISPVGSVITTTTSFNPSSVLGGTWESYGSGVNRVLIASQELYPEATGNSDGSTVNLVCSSQYRLIDGVFSGVPTTAGHHREYRLLAQFYTTGSAAAITVTLNNISMAGGSWTTTKYRRLMNTAFFKETELELQPIFSDTAVSGLNLRATAPASGTAWGLFAVTLSGYMTSDVTEYNWRRIA